MNKKFDTGLDKQFIKDHVNAIIQRIMAQREKIVEAFIAETGLKPSEIEMVEVQGINEKVWYLRKRPVKDLNEQMKQINNSEIKVKSDKIAGILMDIYGMSINICDIDALDLLQKLNETMVKKNYSTAFLFDFKKKDRGKIKDDNL